MIFYAPSEEYDEEKLREKLLLYDSALSVAHQNGYMYEYLGLDKDGMKELNYLETNIENILTQVGFWRYGNEIMQHLLVLEFYEINI